MHGTSTLRIVGDGTRGYWTLVQGRLRTVFLHGIADDNVHFQNTVRLVDALQQAEKRFELMVYPGQRHGLHGGHYQRLHHEFIVRSVGGAASPSP